MKVNKVIILLTKLRGSLSHDNRQQEQMSSASCLTLIHYEADRTLSPPPHAAAPCSTFSRQFSFKPHKHRSGISRGLFKAGIIASVTVVYCLTPTPLIPPLAPSMTWYSCLGALHSRSVGAIAPSVVTKGDFTHSQNSLTCFKVSHLEHYPRKVHMDACTGAPCPQWYREGQ